METLKRWYYQIRYGKVTHRVTGYLGHLVVEYEVLDRRGRVIGYWVNGYLDPAGIYNEMTKW